MTCPLPKSTGLKQHAGRDARQFVQQAIVEQVGADDDGQRIVQCRKAQRSMTEQPCAAGRQTSEPIRTAAARSGRVRATQGGSIKWSHTANRMTPRLNSGPSFGNNRSRSAAWSASSSCRACSDGVRPVAMRQNKGLVSRRPPGSASVDQAMANNSVWPKPFS